MENIERVCKFLDDTGTYYLATVEGDQPRVRPFGTALVFEGKLYIQTGKVKNISKQLAANPKAEICAFDGGKWLRVAGELINDDRIAPKAAMLEKHPELKGMYKRVCTRQRMVIPRYCMSATPQRHSVLSRTHRKRSHSDRPKT